MGSNHGQKVLRSPLCEIFCLGERSVHYCALEMGRYRGKNRSWIQWEHPRWMTEELIPQSTAWRVRYKGTGGFHSRKCGDDSPLKQELDLSPPAGIHRWGSMLESGMNAPTDGPTTYEDDGIEALRNNGFVGESLICIRKLLSLIHI